MKDKQMIWTGLVGCWALLGGLPWSGPGVASAGPTEADMETVVKGNSAFALDLHARLKKEDGNLIFSPYSISTALAMTYAGARGQTERQMAQVLHFSLGQDRLHPAFGALLAPDAAKEDEPGYRLHLANALWGQKGRAFLEEFLSVTRRHYGAGLHEVDFVGAREPARRTINAWVEEQTEDKIKELLKPDDLDSLTRLVLTNAIYFKGDWASQFKKDLTKEAPFRISEEKKVAVPMMHQRGQFRYAADDKLQTLDLPYVGDELSMVVLLPSDVGGLARLEEALTQRNLDRWLGALRECSVDVSLPRFKIKARFDLSKTLSDMGMPDAFGGKADFSGMDGTRELFIKKVIHKAYVDVNEEGTEAAAATAVVMKLRAGGPSPVFIADHPFLFLIRDIRSGSLLFIGRVVDPTT
ncbi:MAG: serpin family protein [Phycisphaerae bacterium]|nr:serpin family protein [Phycisphaerae bacterium]